MKAQDDQPTVIFLELDTVSKFNVLPLQTLLKLGMTAADLEPTNSEVSLRGLSFEHCPVLGMISVGFFIPERVRFHKAMFFVVPDASFPKYEGVLGQGYDRATRDERI